MMGAMACFLTINRMYASREGTLFIDPGFPVQKLQCRVLGHDFMTFDVYDHRGPKLRDKLLSKSGDYIANVVQEGEPQLGSDGLMYVTTQAAVKVREVQKSLNQMTRDERVQLIRASGDPRISMQIDVRDADRAGRRLDARALEGLHQLLEALPFNTAQQVFPGNIVASMFRFQPAELFEIQEAAERAVPTVDLSLKKS